MGTRGYSRDQYTNDDLHERWSGGGTVAAFQAGIHGARRTGLRNMSLSASMTSRKTASMPKISAADREDEVLDLVCAELSSAGRELQIVDRPDRRAPSSVPPVDAIIRVAEDGYDEE